MKILSAILLLLLLSLTARATTYHYDFNAVNTVIPDGSPIGLAMSATVSGIPYVNAGNNYIITGVDVRLNISGGYNGDLYGYLLLRSADGSTVLSVLLNRVGRTNATSFGYASAGFNHNTLNGSWAFNNIHNVPIPIGGGTYLADGRTNNPNGNFTGAISTAGLNVFNGHNANGTWTLFLADMSSGCASTLVSWGLDISVVSPALTNVSYLDNGTVKVGIDLAKGGSITYLSKSGTNDNIINNYDLGRQVQQSYYSGPEPYDPPNNGAIGWTGNPGWTNWPWNPIQTGDSYGNRSQVLSYTNDGQMLYVKCRPMQWALNNKPGECTYESWITLTNSTVIVSNRLLNTRTDIAQQYFARHQELPAVYTIGRLYRLFSYAGNAPFTSGTLTNFPNTPPPWLYWKATESWAALVDVNNWGLGVYHPGAMQFVGGFNSTPGSGGPTNDPCGYMSPLHAEVLDNNIEYTYSYHLILGTLTQIRNWVYAQPYRPECNYAFQTDRQHWSYPNVTDAGWPLTNNRVRVSLASGDPMMVSPACAFPATNAPKLYIRAAHKIANASSGWAQVYWETNGVGGFDGTRSVTFPIVADGQYHNYEVNLTTANNYSGLITQLRFDPAASGNAGDYVDVATISSWPFALSNVVQPGCNLYQAGSKAGISFSTVLGSSVGYIGKNLIYTLESRTNLTVGSWQGVTNLIGDGRVRFITNENINSPAFFRMRVELQQ